MDSNYAKYILEKNITDYNQISGRFSQTRYRNWDEIIDLISQYVKNNDQILDIGCGNGRLLNSLPKNIQYTGIDTSIDLINKAIETHQPNTHDNIHFDTGSILDITTDSNKFNIIFAIAVLNHIPSDDFRAQACRELYRILKPNGYLIMTNWNLFQNKYLPYHNTNLNVDPNLDSNDTLIPWKDQTGEIIVNRYYHAFTPDELQKLLMKQNFTIIKNIIKKHNIVTICKKII